MSQSRVLCSYAATNGIEVVEQFSDDGYSGLHLDRPSLERMRSLAAQGGFDVLLTCGPDRLARKHKLLVVILEELKCFGVKTVFVDGIDPVTADDPMPLSSRADHKVSERSVVLERA